MTDLAPISGPQDLNIPRRPLLPLLLSSAMAAITVMACARAAGPSLGLFFGGFIVAAVVTPAGVLAQQRLAWRLLTLLAITLSIAAVWLSAVFKSPDTPAQWLELSAALLSFIAAIAGVALILTRVRLSISIAAVLTILIALAWLTWPIWLCTFLAQSGSGRITAALVSVNPPLLANGVLTSESPWTEKRLAYQLTNLNQDLPIQLPQNASACILFHGLVGLNLFILAGFRRKPAAVTFSSHPKIS